MAMVASNMSGQLHSKLTRSLEKILEEAHASGELNLSGRKLKEFPNAGEKYDLVDTVIADLSKNRFGELPLEVTAFCSLERLQLYHNTIRFIPDTVVYLQSLTYLDLSRNQLSVLPCVLCQLPLEVLLLSNNKLVGIPEDIGRMRTLTELDASCNEIAHLPKQIGDLPILRALNVRQNHLKELPLEITYLRLVKLDISENRISTLPNELRTMTTLVDLQLSHNPLISPPAQLCRRGRVHIFKYLEIQAMKEDKKRGFLTEDIRRTHKKGGHLSDLRGYSNGIGLDLRHRRYNVDSGYSTSSDGPEKRWSQEMHGEEEISNVKGQWQRVGSAPVDISRPPAEVVTNGNRSGSSTPSTISPGDNMNLEEELGKALILHDQLEKKRLETKTSDREVNRRTTVGLNNDGMKTANGSPRFPSNSVNKVPLSPTEEVGMNGNSLTPTTDDKRPLEHIQTYREYKEALKQQRGQDVYRPRIAGENPTNESCRPPETSINQSPREVDPTNNHEPQLPRNRLDSAPKQILEDVVSKRPVQKVIPCRNGSTVTFQCPPATPSSGPRGEVCYVKPSSPGSPRLVTASVGYVNGTRPQTLSPTPRSPKLGTRAMMWNRDVAPEKLSFTMRREFDKAREEAELIDQLRSLIESRLKMSLPEDMAPVLMDGVVLCHLANHVRPRSVASIHVPSPAVPKLTMARCRRNVDNFLEACRKIGVEEALVCCAADVLEGRGMVQIAITVTELMRFHQPRSPGHVLPCP